MTTRFLPGYISTTAGRVSGARSRKQTTARERTLTVAASGALIPVLYGPVRVPGMIFAQGMIGSDLVVGYIWGIGEIHAIDALYINDRATPITGVTITHYLGTPTQGVDATLSSAIAGYSDSLRIDTPSGKRGIAYTVLRITAAADIGGFPAVQAVIRGRKLYDPRISQTVYSDNAALALGDLITDPDYGHGVPVYGLDEAADWCDALLGNSSEVRAKLGYAIINGATTESYLDILADHAECFWDYSGDGIRLIPDASVDLGTVPVIGAADIIAGTLSIRAEDSKQAPTEVEVQYMSQTAGAEGWQLEPAEPARLAGVADGTVPRIPQSISMEGVYREVEAANKSLAYLNRQQHAVTVSWTTRDYGVLYQKGDVVKIEHAARGVSMPVRIVGVALRAAGRYEVSATRYDASHYPSEIVLPTTFGVVPVGAVVLLQGTTVPSGWGDFADANDKFLIGAGGTYAPGATGGGGTVTFSGSTTTNGAHGPGSGSFEVPSQSGSSGSSTAFQSINNGQMGGHSHAMPTTELTPDPQRRDERLIVKTGTTSVTFPAAAKIFGLGGLSHPDVQRISQHAGLLLRAAATAASHTAQQAVSVKTASANDAHNHLNLSSNSDNPGGILESTRNGNGGGSHDHSGSLVVTANPLRRRLATYGGSTEFPVIPGMIVGWSGSIASIPAGWVLCDGTNDTPNTVDHYVEIAATGQEGTATGDNTVTGAVNNFNSRTHKHNATSGQTRLPQRNSGKHADSESHTHTFSSTQAWMPPYYAMPLIMYRPGE